MKDQWMKKSCHLLLRPLRFPYPKHLEILSTVQGVLTQRVALRLQAGASEEGSARMAEEATVQMLFLWTYSR